MRYIFLPKGFVRPLADKGSNITVFDGRTGSGKSKKMKANVLTERGRHLFVVPRKQSIIECEGDLKDARQGARLIYPVLPFVRDDGKRYAAKITKEITDCAAKYVRETDHCCLIRWMAPQAGRTADQRKSKRTALLSRDVAGAGKAVFDQSSDRA